MEFIGVKTAVAGIRGSSTINHRARVALGLNMTQYAVACYIEDNIHNKDVLTSSKTWKDLGIRDITMIVRQLQMLHVLEIDTNLKFTDKWNTYFNRDNFFDQLWLIFLQKGNKAKAKSLFEKVIKQVEISVLLKAATAYMKTKDPDPSKRSFIMGLEVWLNPSNKHWEDVHEVKEQETVKYKRT